MESGFFVSKMLTTKATLFKTSPHYSTPAAWPLGLSLASKGSPCLSKASWDAFLTFAFARLDPARLGVNGFGDFPRKESHSAAGTKPGIIRGRGNFIRKTQAKRSKEHLFGSGKNQDRFSMRNVENDEMGGLGSNEELR